MCRYAMAGPYKGKYACFKCRKSFRRSHDREFTSPKAAYKDDETRVVCPQCSSPLKSMGLDFKAPAQSNLKQWKKVEILFNNGFIYSSCGCCGPGYRPARLNEVPAFLEAARKQDADWARRRLIEERKQIRDAIRRKKAKQRLKLKISQ